MQELHSFIQQIFTEDLLCASEHSRGLGYIQWPIQTKSSTLGELAFLWKR